MSGQGVPVCLKCSTGWQLPLGGERELRSRGWLCVELACGAVLQLPRPRSCGWRSLAILGSGSGQFWVPRVEGSGRDRTGCLESGVGQGWLGHTESLWRWKESLRDQGCQG